MRAVMFRIMILTIVMGVFAVSDSSLQAQESSDYSSLAEQIYKTALSNGKAYSMLRVLTQEIGGRLSGSPQAAAAVEWGRQAFETARVDRVMLQPVMVPHWVRGDVEEAAIINSNMMGTVPLTICALGGSVATPPEGIVGEVVEVQNFDEVKALGKKAQGKIIFYNRPMDPTKFNTFAAYSGAVDQRSRGAIEAAKVGAVAVLVRSMTTRLDDVPHTGAMHYDNEVKKIPAAAISTMDANLLSDLLKKENGVRVRLRLNCRTLPDAPSHNVIGEIRGSEKPEEIVLLGAHLDSWDKGQGAHDDGAGCVQVIEALRIIKAMGLQPKRTIRGVLFMNEENGMRGGLAYADSAKNDSLKHILAVESDRGGFMPRGFSVDANGDILSKLKQWEKLFAPIQADQIRKGYGGVDIWPLKKLGTPLMGLVVDSQRYFDYHHSDNDTFDKVNERELELGAASMAILAYVIAQEGL